MSGTGLSGTGLSGRLVVFDRDPGIFCLLSLALDDQSTIAWTSQESEVLRAVCELRPQVLILGTGLPAIEWRGFFESVRPNTGPCRIVGVASPEQLALVRRFTEYGVDGIFWRSTELGELLRRVTQLLATVESKRLPWQAHNRHVDRILAYLALHLVNRFTLEEIAREIGVSVSHLTHLFATAAGTTLKAYVLQLKVALAKRLLIMTPAKLEVVAEDCGFCDASHLSRVFRQYVGCWPGEFRDEGLRKVFGRAQGAIEMHRTA